MTGAIERHPEQAEYDRVQALLEDMRELCTPKGEEAPPQSVTVPIGALTSLMKEVRVWQRMRQEFIWEQEHKASWHDKQQPELVITQAALMALPEYSASLPSGKTIGKRWRININFFRQRRTYGIPDEWRIGEYTRLSVDYPGEIDITYYRPVEGSVAS